MTRRVLLVVALALIPAASAASSRPHRLQGVPLRGPTHLRLVVSGTPPFLLDVDTGKVTRVRGLGRLHQAVVSVSPVGRDAVVWVDRPNDPGSTPAEVYVLRRGSTHVRLIAHGRQVAAATNGEAVWIKAYRSGGRCELNEVSLDGKVLRHRALSCRTDLRAYGVTPALGRGARLADPVTGRTILRSRAVWTLAGHSAVLVRERHSVSVLDLRTQRRRRLRWPHWASGPYAGPDEAAVQPGGNLVVLGFSDPSYQDTGEQVTDLWLLDTATGRERRLPGMPVDVPLKFTSTKMTRDGRLVMLTDAPRLVGYRLVPTWRVVVWRPGQKKLALKRVKIPTEYPGSDAFVVWSS